MSEIVLSTLNARYIHCAFGLRYLHANLGDLQSRAEIREFTINQRPVDVAEALRAKLAVAKQPGAPKDYQSIKLDKDDLVHLEAFLKLLDDVEDKNFRGLILQAKVLDTSQN